MSVAVLGGGFGVSAIAFSQHKRSFEVLLAGWSHLIIMSQLGLSVIDNIQAHVRSNPGAFGGRPNSKEHP